MTEVLSIVDLSVTYPDGTAAVRGVSLSLGAGRCLAIVGESGSGKSTVLRTLLSLLPHGSTCTGTATVAGIDALAPDPAALRRLRGELVGHVGQDPYATLDPLWSVGHHLREAWRARGLRAPREAAVRRAAELGIPDAAARLRQRPHRWSGGMLQRASIAGANVHRPVLTLADEPTSALDAELAASTLEVLRRDSGALLLVCHDLRHVRAVADEVAVMRDGVVVESGPVARILDAPRHPYTRRLVAALPRPRTPGPRPDAPVVLEAVGLSRAYRHRRTVVHAVRDAHVDVRAGEVLGIHGPSGSGKSTLLRLLMGLETPDAGNLRCDPRPGWVMPVFQDARGSLDARWPVWRSVAEPWRVRHRDGDARTAAERWLARVGLDGIDPAARPGELSLGQCQRVAIARALIAGPDLLVADEPTASLDAVSAGRIARLLRDIADEEGTAVVVVSHDTERLAGIADRVLRMEGGRLG